MITIGKQEKISFHSIRNYRLIVLGLMLLLALLITLGLQHLYQVGTVFTHLFYIPIILSCIWWGYRGLAVPLILSGFLMISHFLLQSEVDKMNDFLRSVCFFSVAVIIINIQNKAVDFQQQLQEKERIFRMVFNGIQENIAIFRVAENGDRFILEDMNRAMEATERCDRRNTIGKEVTEVFPGIGRTGLLSVFKQVWRTGFPESVPPVYYQDERIEGWRDNSVFRLDGELIVTLYRDITRAKQDEVALQQLTQSLDRKVKYLKCMYAITLLSEKKGYSLVEIYQKIIECLLASIAYPAFTSARIVMVEDNITVISKGFRNSLHERIADIIAFERLVGRLEIYRMEPNDTLNEKNVFTDEEVELIETVALRIGRITELKKAQAEIEQHQALLEQKIEKRTQQLIVAKEAAEKANIAKDLFLANISHDIRNPLHGIINFAKFGFTRIDKAGPVKLQSYFENIYEAGNRLLELVDDLLDLTKLESGKMEFQFSEYDIRDIVHTVQSAFETRLEEDNLDLTTCLPASPVITTCDVNKINRVITNLVANAIKFTPDGKRINIAVQETTPNSNPLESTGSITVSVYNQGPKIPEDELEHVFERFYQSPVATNKTINGMKGTGLGLAICQEIIFAHQGKIWAENVSTGGVKFCFTLQRKPAGGEKYFGI